MEAPGDVASRCCSPTVCGLFDRSFPSCRLYGADARFMARKKLSSKLMAWLNFRVVHRQGYRAAIPDRDALNGAVCHSSHVNQSQPSNRELRMKNLGTLTETKNDIHTALHINADGRNGGGWIVFYASDRG